MERGGMWVWVQRGLNVQPSPFTPCPHLGTSQAMVIPEASVSRAAQGHRSHSWCGQVTAYPRSPPARRPTELNYHIGNSKVNTNR